MQEPIDINDEFTGQTREMARKLLMDQLKQFYLDGLSTEGAVLQAMQRLRTKQRLKWRPDKISVNLAVEAVVAELTSIAAAGERSRRSPKQIVEFHVLRRLGQRDDLLTEVAQVRQQLLARALGCSVAEVLAIAIALDNGSKPAALAGKGSGAPATDWEVVKHMFRLWLCGNTIDEIAAAVCVRTEATVVTQLRKLIAHLKDVAGEAHAATMILLGIMLWLLRNLLAKYNLPSSPGHIAAKWTLMAISAASLTADTPNHIGVAPTVIRPTGVDARRDMPVGDLQISLPRGATAAEEGHRDAAKTPVSPPQAITKTQSGQPAGGSSWALSATAPDGGICDPIGGPLVDFDNRIIGLKLL